jgi:uncharacterized protein (TIGR02594 family)
MRLPLLATILLCLMATPGRADPIDPTSAGITGFMRYANEPWLHRAMGDVGKNPTGWGRKWCARSVNLWLQQSGKHGCGGNTAISCLHAGRRLSGPQVGALAVMGHHVGIVKEVNGSSVTLVSGNQNHRVGVGRYSRSRVVAYVWPE